MRLLILAGGFGTRLQPVVNDVPKALAPVGKVPFLTLQLQNWINQGVTSFVFLLHHRADQIINYLEDEKYTLLKKCEVDWLVEPMPLDTGGAISYAIEKIGISGSFLVTNADTWLSGGIQELLKFPSPSIGVVYRNDTSRYGAVTFDLSGGIQSFTEKDSTQSSGWINAGLYHLDAKYFKGYQNKRFSLEKELFINLISNNRLKAIQLDSDFIDIGVPDDYHRFINWIFKGAKGSLCN
jgi:D-glycero-alpha-D-manno-heptose 1-phosphate guanylyltransferase